MVGEGGVGVGVGVYLSRHDFGVGATDVHAGVETRSVVSLHDVPTVGLVRAHPTVVRPWTGETGRVQITQHATPKLSACVYVYV